MLAHTLSLARGSCSLAFSLAWGLSVAFSPAQGLLLLAAMVVCSVSGCVAVAIEVADEVEVAIGVFKVAENDVVVKVAIFSICLANVVIGSVNILFALCANAAILNAKCPASLLFTGALGMPTAESGHQRFTVLMPGEPAASLPALSP